MRRYDSVNATVLAQPYNNRQISGTNKSPISYSRIHRQYDLGSPLQPSSCQTVDCNSNSLCSP